MERSQTSYRDDLSLYNSTIKKINEVESITKDHCKSGRTPPQESPALKKYNKEMTEFVSNFQIVERFHAIFELKCRSLPYHLTQSLYRGISVGGSSTELSSFLPSSMNTALT